MSSPAPTPRTIRAIAADIVAAWGSKVNYAAAPYLHAMRTLDRPSDYYYADPGDEIVLRFLANASTFRGEQARALKAELKALL